MLGVTSRAVSLLAERGVLKRSEGVGRWPLPESVSNYIDAIRSDRKAKSGSYEEAKKREKAAKARIAEAQADIQEGKLLPVEVVGEANASILTAFVTRLCNYGDGIANVCHNQPAEFVADRVNGGLRSALRELAKLPHVPENVKKKTLRQLGFAEPLKRG